MNSQLYRPCVGIVLFNTDGHVFVGERIDTPDAWQMPQGGIDENEDLKTAALRELEEETGISAANVKILKIADEKLRYDLPDDLTKYKMENKAYWNGKYKGQEQTWVAMRFLGDDKDIKLDAHEPQEFSRWKWMPLKNTPDVIVPFKKDIYRQVIRIFEKESMMQV